ncbi:hypothetical protein NPIL_121931 [Nephila pilipes]|uniref:Uncharacterized protein n=1 Tax=Nephila pilipes TaxID=299642 RepID=A0A8X6R293_NEPPI|nr:hypothetical protein NPIL_121931 [Nephila pilipes]
MQNVTRCSPCLFVSPHSFKPKSLAILLLRNASALQSPQLRRRRQAVQVEAGGAGCAGGGRVELFCRRRQAEQAAQVEVELSCFSPATVLVLVFETV